MNNSVEPRIFLSYSRVDSFDAAELAKKLGAYKAQVWFDQTSLKPGLNWKLSIKEAIRSSRYFVVLLSSKCINRKGFLNYEITEALEILREFPITDTYIIAIRLDDCIPAHPQLKDLHFLDFFPSKDDAFHKLLIAIGIGGEPDKRDVLEITICARCGSSDLTFFEVRTSGIHNVGLECKKCKWRFLSNLEIYDLNSDDRQILHDRHGPIDWREW